MLRICECVYRRRLFQRHHADERINSVDVVIAIWIVGVGISRIVFVGVMGSMRVFLIVRIFIGSGVLLLCSRVNKLGVVVRIVVND